jgi:hypothetical protein
MFVTKKEMERQIALVEMAVGTLDQRYWLLWHRHERLLKHLRLVEETKPESTVLRTKGGPEQG